jgi:hypothetical protein
MFPQPKTGDWRPDVLGVEKLSMQPGPDGWPLINGHRVTEEMCAAIQAERPDQADYFVYEDIIDMARELGGPDFGGPLFEGFTGGGSQFNPSLFGSSTGGCSGRQLDHKDGSMSCSRGLSCPGVALPHQGWGPCDLYEPCAFCAGPPVTWVCDRH